MKIKMPLLTELIARALGRRKAVPSPSEPCVFTNEDDNYEIEIIKPNNVLVSPGRVAFDAADIQRHLISNGYQPAEILLVIGRMYGSIAGSFEGNAIDTTDLEKKFFEMCRKERMVVSGMMSKMNDNKPDAGSIH